MNEVSLTISSWYRSASLISLLYYQRRDIQCTKYVRVSFVWRLTQDQFAPGQHTRGKINITSCIIGTKKLLHHIKVVIQKGGILLYDFELTKFNM